MAANEAWLISAPAETTLQQTWETLENATRKSGLCTNHKFHIPDLKVGTLDQLVALSDDLSKLDAFCEGITRKLTQYMADTIENDKDKMQENFVVNNMDPLTYLSRFQWDAAKYPIKQSLKTVSDIIAKQVSQIDSDLKVKAQAYNALKGTIQALERKQGGSLLNRGLSEIVKKEDFLLGSEYLSTILVVVPKTYFKDWENKYENLSDMIVPRSSRLLSEDNEYGLFAVIVFTNVIEEFRNRCRENKFVVRDFVYDETAVTASRTEMDRLSTDKQKQFGPLVRWLKVNFSESFAAWIHVKALRVFAESVLRFGLPVNFQAMLLIPGKKATKRLREVLYNLYKHLDNTSEDKKEKPEAIMDIPGLLSSDYYPYVFFKISLELLEIEKRN